MNDFYNSATSDDISDSRELLELTHDLYAKLDMAEKDLAIMTRARDHEQDMRKQHHATVARIVEWAKGCGCWTCDNAGKCGHQDDDGNVLNGGICPHHVPPSAWCLKP